MLLLVFEERFAIYCLAEQERVIDNTNGRFITNSSLIKRKAIGYERSCFSTRDQDPQGKWS